ncbi:hypothetical protein DXG03_009700 [Asterophora parasitica]|uniref:Uncharacterized protein n=1 Tax=Asterophora parasitica TaxID=117018 RepID=A0A9P7G4A2_9AGAR|nr:hypothetical protein DXG03_009700 [Asterophora parasitica]
MGKLDALFHHLEFFAIQATKGLMVMGEEDEVLKAIWQGNQEGAQEDAVAKAAQLVNSWITGHALCFGKWGDENGLLIF